jgi:putative aminopeptidase FrvX
LRPKGAKFEKGEKEMEKESIDFLKRLIDAPSPSGFEGPVRKIWQERMERFADEVRVDLQGNVIATLNPDGKPRVMLAGHCDEVGFMVRYINDEGFVYFVPIGGVDPGIVSARRVRIHTKKGVVFGVVGRKAIHLMDDEERKKVPKYHQLWIDIGAKDKKEGESIVSVGDPIVFDQGFQELRGKLVVGRGFDDRVGSFAVGETLRLLSQAYPKASVYAVATVQEELGMRGARTSAFGISPQVGIAVDVDNSTDYPDSENKEKFGELTLGGGPVIARGANINPVVETLLVETAQREKVPYQIAGEPAGTGTDANVIQITREGVAAGLVSIPNRYMHTPVEIISLEDLENVSRLLASFIMQIDETTDFTP